LARCGGGATIPLPRDGGDLTVRPHPKVWTIEVKNGRSSAKDDAPERLKCGTIQKEVSLDHVDDICRRCKKSYLPFYPA